MAAEFLLGILIHLFSLILSDVRTIPAVILNLKSCVVLQFGSLRVHAYF